jgi:hypothetical protein
MCGLLRAQSSSDQETFLTAQEAVFMHWPCHELLPHGAARYRAIHDKMSALGGKGFVGGEIVAFLAITGAPEAHRRPHAPRTDYLLRKQTGAG